MGFTKSDLNNKTVPQLREVAKHLGIVGRWDMKKDDLIASILSTQESFENVKNDEKQDINTDHSKYLKNIEIGRLVAYHDFMGYIHTAKVLHYSQSRRMLRVIDIKGNVEDVSFSNVEWVKTGKRWPKKIFEAFKRSTNILKIMEHIGE